ncbi:MAG TPA: hypothetical protein VLA29_05905 [Acidimicrobiia bacterium]|nr:hypothetical protein [Acidimicrobiia bacterium]
MKRHEPEAGFTLGDDDYQVVRYGAPQKKEDWVALLGMLLGCSSADAELAHDAMFPDGYDSHGSEDVALVLVDPGADGDDAYD